MNVLTTSTSEQSLNVITRSLTFDQLFLTDESTNVQTEVSINSIIDKGYYSEVNANFELVENRFYRVEIRNEGIIVYRGKLFCTDQSIVTFSVNNGQYVSHSTSNEFITYE